MEGSEYESAGLDPFARVLASGYNFSKSRSSLRNPGNFKMEFCRYPPDGKESVTRIRVRERDSGM